MEWRLVCDRIATIEEVGHDVQRKTTCARRCNFVGSRDAPDGNSKHGVARLWTRVLRVMAWVHPGCHVAGNIVQLAIGTVYGIVDGLVGGLVFGPLYSRLT